MLIKRRNIFIEKIIFILDADLIYSLIGKLAEKGYFVEQVLNKKFFQLPHRIRSL